MVLLRSCAPGVISAWYSPFELVMLRAAIETWLPSSPARSWKWPASTNRNGSLKVTKTCAFGATEFALFAGLVAVTCGGVPSRVTLFTSGPAGRGTVTLAPRVRPSGP